MLTMMLGARGSDGSGGAFRLLVSEVISVENVGRSCGFGGCVWADRLVSEVFFLLFAWLSQE